LTLTLPAGQNSKTHVDEAPDPSLSNKIGEADGCCVWLGKQLLYAACSNLVIDSDDTDVSMIALMQYYRPAPYGDGAQVYVYRQAANETVDITATAQILSEPNLRLTVADFIFVFATSGTDFTSGITGFSHAKILKHYIQNKSDGNQIGALATIDESGELQFHTAAFERLFVSLYYERDKGGAHAVNFRASFGDAEGQTVQQLYHNTDAAHTRATAAAVMAGSNGAHSTVYDIVRQVTIEQQGVEARTLCRWSAMLRHKARCQWLVGQYWASILASPQPVNGQPFELVYAESTRANADGVAGWALVHQGAKCPHTTGEHCACELQVEWDEDVWEADVPGCGCKGGKRDPCAGRCLCKGGENGARHRCGPMCRCLGGPRCANNRQLDAPPPAAASVATARARAQPAMPLNFATPVHALTSAVAAAATASDDEAPSVGERGGGEQWDGDGDGDEESEDDDDADGGSDEEEVAMRLSHEDADEEEDAEEEDSEEEGDDDAEKEEGEDVAPFLGLE
jgi:hypothetical protein